jgi:lipopolysaccharide transport system ATP-binding protein
MADTVIKVQNLYKEYRLGVVSHGTLRHDLASWWAKCRGKEDPNSLVTQLKKQTPQSPTATASFPSTAGDAPPLIKVSKKDEEELKQHFLALNNISFEVKRGEVLGIIGRNGAGKSTLLKVLSRITSPSSGEIMLKGRMASLLEVGTGFHPELTGRENIYMNGAILGMRKREVASKIDEIVAFSELEKFIDTPVKRYSSGMYVRLAFAVAAHLDSDILLLDEVLAVGDAQFQKKCLGKMDDVAKTQGRTVLFVSHNMAAIRQLCSRCIFLENGLVTMEGDTNAATEYYLNKIIKNNASGAEKIFKEDPQKEFQVLAVRLKNNKGEINQTYECDEPVLVEIECISRKSVPGLYGYLGIDNNEGIRILVSDTFDLLPNVLDNLEPKKYKINIEIPARTLAHGNYSVLLSFASSQAVKNFHIDNPQYTCSFSLSDSTTSRGNNRQGYLSTLLKWDIKKN